MSVSNAMLHIHVLECRCSNYKNEQLLCCQLNINQQIFKTKQTGSPFKWNEHFECSIDNETNTLTIIILDVKNEINRLTIDLDAHKDVALSFAKSHWYKFKNVHHLPKVTKITKKKSKPCVQFTINEINLRIGVKNPTIDKTITSSLLTVSRSNNISDYDTVPLDDITQESKQLAEECYDSTERSLRLMHKIHELGVTTSAVLHEQGDQLKRSKATIKEIDTELKVADRDLRGISSIGGELVNMVTSRPKASRDKYEDKYTDKSISSEVVSGKSQVINPSTNLTREMIRRGEFDHLEEETITKIAKTEDNLEEISILIDDVQVIAKNIGEEIDRQNLFLEDVIPAIKRTNVKVKKVINKTRRQY